MANTRVGGSRHLCRPLKKKKKVSFGRKYI
jgi:hypothetical protein